jgi:hypothetical protein
MLAERKEGLAYMNISHRSQKLDLKRIPFSRLRRTYTILQ